MTLSEINKLIQSKGIKKKFLAQQINVTPEYLSGVLNGRIVPGNIKDVFKLISDFLKK